MNELLTYSIEVGGNGGIPYIYLTFAGQEYNLLSFLENSDILNMITWCKNIIGVYFVLNIIVNIVTGIPHIIRGKYNLTNKSDAFEVASANIEGYRWDL